MGRVWIIYGLDWASDGNDSPFYYCSTELLAHQLIAELDLDTRYYSVGSENVYTKLPEIVKEYIMDARVFLTGEPEIMDRYNAYLPGDEAITGLKEVGWLKPVLVEPLRSRKYIQIRVFGTDKERVAKKYEVFFTKAVKDMEALFLHGTKPNEDKHGPLV